MSEPTVTDAQIVEFLNGRVQRLAATLNALLAGKPVAHILDCLTLDEGVITPEAMAELQSNYAKESYEIMQVLCPIPKSVMQEVLAGEYNLLNECWPQVKEAIAVNIATYVLRHKEPVYDFDTRMLLKQMLKEPENSN